MQLAQNEIKFLSEHYEVETLMFDNKISNFFICKVYFTYSFKQDMNKK